jgi:multimeric flavodoxin WrbA
MDEILGKYPNADFLIFATPLKAGFMTSYTKKTMDRMIPLVLPYIELFNEECHHPQRYENNPVMGIIVFDENSEQEAVDLTFSSMDRLNLNFHGKRVFKKLVSIKNMEEVLENEISNY